MKQKLLTILLTVTVILAGTVFNANAQQPGLMLPQGSVANVDNALASLINPAALGMGKDVSLYGFMPYYGGDDGTQGTDWGFSLGLGGTAFTAQFLRNKMLYAEPADLYTYATGFGKDGFYMGTSYTWSSGIHRDNSWDIGFLVRPLNSLSVGAVARNINNPRLYGIMQDVGWDFGLAIRPLGWFGPIGNEWSHRVTLLADANMRKTSGTKYTDNLNYKFGAEAEIVPGVVAHFDYSPEITDGIYVHDNTLWAGMKFSLGNAEAGVYQRDAKGDAGSGVAYFGSSTMKKESWLVPQKKKWVEIRLNEPIVDYAPPKFSFFPESKRELSKLIDNIEKLGDDPNVTGIVLKLEGFSAGFSKLQELRDALLDFKIKGKKIVVYMEEGGNGQYYLASVADKIYLAPASGLSLMGFASEMWFLRGTFDKLGVNPEMEHIGDYKSYSDMFTRSDMAPAQKEATDAILDDYYKFFVQAIADGRTMFNDDVKALIDKGPFTSREAYDNKLVDSLVYEDMIPDLLKGIDGSDKKPKVVSERGYLMNNRKADREWFDMRKKTIAVVYASGGITSGESSGGGLFGGESMGSKTMVKAIRQARKDKNVSAIVLRVDSPGGSALASEMILREINLARTGDDKKPVIVSMSDVAGSGGYYIACSADTIVALPGTITGSIGVVSGKFSWDVLQKKLGLNTATLKRGQNADMYTSNRSFTPEERDKLRDHINQLYIEFITHVAKGRDMDTAAVNKIGQGRIWSGSAGKANGLVDVLGGLKTAIDLAAKAGGIREGEAYNIKSYPQPFGGAMDDGVFDEALIRLARTSIPEGALKTLDRVSDESRWTDGEILYLMPYEIEVK